MLSCLLAVTHLALAPVQAPPEPARITSLTGTIVEVAGFESKVLKNKRNLHIYLPPGYDREKNRRYPVLYVHDGQNVFNGASSYLPNKEWRLDETAHALIGAGLIEPLIMVGIDNAGIDRANEYLPTSIKMGNNPAFGGRADLYGRMLIEEIKPMIDGTYRTKKDARNTGLMGSSFGGVITLYLGLKHPDVFQRLGVVSPSLWVDDRILIKQIQNLPKRLPLKVWLDMGGLEGPNPYENSRMAREALVKKGWRAGRDLAYYEEGFAEHNEDAWARRSPAILMFLFGR